MYNTCRMEVALKYVHISHRASLTPFSPCCRLIDKHLHRHHQHHHWNIQSSRQQHGKQCIIHIHFTARESKFTVDIYRLPFYCRDFESLWKKKNILEKKIWNKMYVHKTFTFTFCIMVNTIVYENRNSMTWDHIIIIPLYNSQ